MSSNDIGTPHGSVRKDELMYRTWMVILLVVALATTAGTASAVPISLDFEGATGDVLDGTDLFIYAASSGGDDFSLTLTATGGDFNKTSSGFGINAPGSGDDTDALDNGLVSESMRIAFDTTANVGVKLISLEFDRMTGGGGVGEDQAFLSFYSSPGVLDNTITVTNANTAGDDTANFNGIDFAEQIANPGSYFEISVADGNGFGIEVLTVEVSAAYYSGSGGAVPEPSTAILMILGMAACLGYRRRR